MKMPALDPIMSVTAVVPTLHVALSHSTIKLPPGAGMTCLFQHEDITKCGGGVRPCPFCLLRSIISHIMGTCQSTMHLLVTLLLRIRAML